jgi:hypothetical protein
MGCPERRHFVSGASVAASTGASVVGAPPPGPLACSVAYNGAGGSGTTTVTGASGTAPGIVQTTESGGTPPYTITLFALQNEPSGKLSMYDGGTGATNIAYTGFVVNEIESAYIRYSIRDSLGATATSRFPDATNFSIKRTS